MSGLARAWLVVGSMMGLLCGAIMGWGPELLHIQEQQHFRLFVIFLVTHLPYLALLLCVYNKADIAALALGAGIAFVSIHFGITLLFWTGLAGMLGGGLDERTYFPIISLFPGSLVLAPGVLVAFIQSKKKMGTLGAMASGCFGIFIVYFLAWSAWSHPPVPGPDEALDESAIEHAYVHINACNHQYAQANPDKGFVTSLEQLGPTGTNCLTPAEQSGEVGNRKLQYEPGATANGKVATYRLAETSPGFLRDSNRLETDQTGLIIWRSTGGGVFPARYTASEESLTLTNLKLLFFCLKAKFNQVGSFPDKLASLKGRTSSSCASVKDYNFLDANTIQTGPTVLSGTFQIFYSPVLYPETRKAVSYKLYSRPLVYGQDGVRSFLISPDGAIYITPENRAPSLSDPKLSSF